MCRLVARGDRIDFRLSLFKGHVRAQPADHGEVMQVVPHLHLRRQGRQEGEPDLDEAAREHESARCDADDFVAGVVDADGAADDVRRATKLPLPEIEADDHRARSSEPVVLRPKGATQDRHHASCREHVAGALAHPDPHRLGIARLGRHRDGPRCVGRYVLEARRALLPVEEISRRNRHPRLAGPEIALVQRGQPLRRLERKRPQQQRVHDAENRGTRANAERQRDDHQQGEPRPFRERAQGKRHVAPNRFHWHSLLRRRAVAPAVGRGSLRIGWPRAL